MYFKFLILIHIFGAIIGFGPTFSFALLGPMASKRPGPGGLALLEAIEAIEKKLTYPFAFVLQPLTGTLMIFNHHWNEGFFHHYWLWIAILLYITAFYLAIFVQTPTVVKMIELIKSGHAESREFAASASRTSRMGPVITILLVIIMFLMIWKPWG